MPDVLTRSDEAGHQRISCWVVLKDHARSGGSHFFMLQVSTAAPDYTADMANVFYVAISNFDLLHPTSWAHAEQLRTLARSVPVKFTTAFPLSWLQVENPLSDEHFYQVKLVKTSNGQPVARLSFAMLVGQSEADLRHLAQEDQVALLEEGLTLEPANFESAPVAGVLREPLTATVQQINTAVDELAHEYEIVLSPVGDDVWLYATRLAPTRRSGAEAWAVSRQAFAILLEQLKVG